MNKSLLVLFLISLCLSSAYAEIITVEPEYKERYENLLSELRCLVCQNQTVAESPSGLADDFRKEVKEMLERGATDDEILTFMSDRYGDFVLYKPPVKARTYLLWIGPFVLLIGGVLIVIMLVKRKAKEDQEKQLNLQDKERLKSLLDENKDDK